MILVAEILNFQVRPNQNIPNEPLFGTSECIRCLYAKS